MKTTANDAVLKDISFVKLSTKREKQILLYYYKIMFGMASPTLQPLISKMYKDYHHTCFVRAQMSRFLWLKRIYFLTFFFRKAASLWNAVLIVFKSSANFFPLNYV